MTLNSDYTLIWEDGEQEFVEGRTMEDAISNAKKEIEGVAWLEEKHTFWINAKIRIPSGNHQSFLKAIHPVGPDCSYTDITQVHEWKRPVEIVGGIASNPGVVGNGRGVLISEVCMNCGCRQLTNTWDQDPETGEQGLTSIKHTEGFYKERLRITYS